MLVRESLIALSLAVVFVSHAFAECDHCGCSCGCRKVCHLKCDVKKVTKVEYSCECEDFCVPGKSEKVGYKCDCDCGHCLFGCCEKPIYKPTCAEVHTKKKLVKHEVTKEEPTYKWVVETVCDECAHRCITCADGLARSQVEAETRAKFATTPESLRPAAPPQPQARKASWLANFGGKGN